MQQIHCIVLCQIARSQLGVVVFFFFSIFNHEIMTNTRAIEIRSIESLQPLQQLLWYNIRTRFRSLVRHSLSLSKYLTWNVLDGHFSYKGLSSVLLWHLINSHLPFFVPPPSSSDVSLHHKKRPCDVFASLKKFKSSQPAESCRWRLCPGHL